VSHLDRSFIIGQDFDRNGIFIFIEIEENLDISTQIDMLAKFQLFFSNARLRFFGCAGS